MSNVNPVSILRNEQRISREIHRLDETEINEGSQQEEVRSTEYKKHDELQRKCQKTDANNWVNAW